MKLDSLHGPYSRSKVVRHMPGETWRWFRYSTRREGKDETRTSLYPGSTTLPAECNQDQPQARTKTAAFSLYHRAISRSLALYLFYHHIKVAFERNAI